MEKIKKQTVAEFLDDIASKTPAPGGGSTAAISGAMAASLVSFVCQVTIGKKKYRDVEPEMRKILKISEQLRKRLLDLAEEDKQAYLEVVAVKKSKDEDKKEAARKQVIAVPVEIVQLCQKVQRLAEDVEKIGNENAGTDAQCAVTLVKAAIWCAHLNVMVNK